MMQLAGLILNCSGIHMLKVSITFLELECSHSIVVYSVGQELEVFSLWGIASFFLLHRESG